MKTAYLDCFSGISGDMFLGALLDAGLAFESLNEAITSLGIHGFKLESHRELRNGISGTKFNVHLEKHEHAHRGLSQIQQIIEKSGLNENVKQKSIEIFRSLAEVEGRIHGISMEEVHFHEVGAVDSIVDIIGTVFALDSMGIERLDASPIPLGTGLLESSHGRIPIPAPATLALLKGIPVYDSGLNKEMVTPTGAALLKSLTDSFGSMPPMTIDGIGYGVGTRNLSDRPNLLRIMIGRESLDQDTDTIVILETNLDDCPPEWMGLLMEDLFEAGALDVVFSPIQMKKNRPGTQVQIIGQPQDKDILAETLFKGSTSIGIRFRYSQRKTLKRESINFDSPWGKLKVKKIRQPNGRWIIMPEYEECRRLAKEHRLPLKEIYAWVNSLNTVR